MQADLAESDTAFAAALASASRAWTDRLEQIASRSEIAESGWWANLLRMAGRRPVALQHAK